MSYLRYIARRAAFAIASVYVIVTVAFLIETALIGNDVQNAIAVARFLGASEAELIRLRRSLTSTFGLDQPFLDRLVGWWVDVTTFDWGYSSAYEEPIFAVLDGRVLTTLEYVLPGLVLAVVFGILAGLFAALRKNGAFDWTARLGSYLLLGIPAFMIATYLEVLGGVEVPLLDGWVLVLVELDALTIAAIAVAMGLLAGQLRFSRASALEQSGEAFMKMLRAKGASRLRLARHVLRNAALPIVSLSLTELLAVLVLNIYVLERVLDIDGLALVSFRAIGIVEGGRIEAVMADVPLLIWSVMLIVFIGIALSFLQDVLHGYLDPRIRSD